jgi:hypothetical protein
MAERLDLAGCLEEHGDRWPTLQPWQFADEDAEPMHVVDNRPGVGDRLQHHRPVRRLACALALSPERGTKVSIGSIVMSIEKLIPSSAKACLRWRAFGSRRNGESSLSRTTDGIGASSGVGDT